MPNDKPHNGGNWTAARFHSFIKGGLRALTNRWGPKNECKKKARVARGIYRCAGFGIPAHKVPASIVDDKKGRINNVYVDHIIPIIGPEGFVSWDQTIKRMFCEVDGLQVLCKECHDNKTKQEREQNVIARKDRKQSTDSGEDV